MSVTSINFRALVDEVCQAKPYDESDAWGILWLFLGRRAEIRGFMQNMTPEGDERHLDWLVGREAAQRASLSEDDVDYMVERLIQRLAQEPWPPQYVVTLLERAYDDRAVEPAVRVLYRSLGATDDAAQACGTAALNILAKYGHWPEVWDAVEAAATRGNGEVAEHAQEMLQIWRSH